MVKLLKKIWNKFKLLLRALIIKIADILNIKIEEAKLEAFMQMIKFGIVGVSNTIISYTTYVIVCLLGFSFHMGNIMGFIFSVLNSFYWNNKYVFKIEKNEQRLWWKALIKTFISYAFSGLILVEILSIIWIDYFHISKFLSPFLNLIITIPINFVMNKLWAFRGEKKRAL